jgi:hypothetical protein
MARVVTATAGSWDVARLYHLGPLTPPRAAQPVRLRAHKIATPTRFVALAGQNPAAAVAVTLHIVGRIAVPRRTRSSTQTTAIRPPIKRGAPTEETPTLPLTPVEVESLVQGAAPSAPLPPDASTRRTVENFRPALGSDSIPAAAPAMAAGSASVAETLPATDSAGSSLPAAVIAAAGSSRFAVPDLPGSQPSVTAPARPTSPPSASPPSTAPSPGAARGTRRTRETLRADAIKIPPPPPRKR